MANSVSPLNKLSVAFQIWDPDASGGPKLVTQTDQNYVWNSTPNDMNTGSNGGKAAMYLAIAGSAAGSLNGITVSGGTVTIQYQRAQTIFEVVIEEDFYGSGTHKLDFSDIDDVGYYEFGFFNGYEQVHFTGFRAIDPAI